MSYREHHKVIFIGPMKTGTTWIYDQITSSRLATKEIYFPRSFFRGFVYRKYVKGSRFLVWPYLLHNKPSLDSLVKMLDEKGHTYEFVVSCRARRSWLASRQRFFARTGSRSDAKLFALKDLRRVLTNLRDLRKYDAPITYINIFDREDQTISSLQKLTGINTHDLKSALKSVSYATADSSIIPTRRLARLYFRLKPFFPKRLQKLRRVHFALTVSRDTDKSGR